MKKICVGGLCVLFVMLFAGQGFAQKPLQAITIQLDFFPNANFAGILLAKERGWYEDVGIDLTIKGWEQGITPIDEVVAGRAQIGVVTGSLLIEARAHGVPVKAISAQYQKSPVCFVSKKERGIETPELLVGKRVGISTPTTVIMTKIVLGNRGLHYDDIIPVQTGADLQLLINDEVDVFTGFMNNQPLTMKEKGYEVIYIPAFKYGYDFYDKVYFVTETMIREKPELIQDFLDVSLRGLKEAYKDPAAAAQFVVEKYFPKRSVQQQMELLKIAHTLATLGEGKKFLGWMEERTWQQGVDILYDFQQIEQKIPAEDLFTLEFLKNIYFGK